MAVLSKPVPKPTAKPNGNELPNGRLYNLKPRVKGSFVNCVLTKEEKIDMDKQIEAYIEKNNLHPNPNTPRPQITRMVKGAKNGSTKQTIEGIKKEYRPKWLEVGRFAYLIGDIRTATICSDELRPSKPRPARPETLELYLMYKAYGDPEDEILDRDGHPVKWKYGAKAGMAIQGCGKWSAAVNARKSRTALKMLHLPFKSTSGVYSESCEGCLYTNEHDAKGERVHPVDFHNMEPGRVYNACLECK